MAINRISIQGGKVVKADGSSISFADILLRLDEVLADLKEAGVGEKLTEISGKIPEDDLGALLTEISGKIPEGDLASLLADIDATLSDLYAAYIADEPDTTIAYADTVVAAADASTQVLAANPDRVYALIINDSDTTIYLRVGAAAELNKGIRLNAEGGSYEMASSLGNLSKAAIFAIHAETGVPKILLVVSGEQEV